MSTVLCDAGPLIVLGKLNRLDFPAHRLVPRLAHGTPAKRLPFQIGGAGYGIHWPDLDEDIGVEGLLRGRMSAESPASFERWLQNRTAAS